MSASYQDFWKQIGGIEGWNIVKNDIKELVTNPSMWATNLIEYATQNNTDSSDVKGMNDAAWQRVSVALDVMKWLSEK